MTFEINMNHHVINKEDNELNVKPVKINIYRFKFSDEINEELLKFSKTYQYSDRLTYKEKWTEWVELNREMIDEEIKKLNQLGYEGDILDKMFKASRYYFRKKSLGKVDAKPRQKYNSVDQEILYKMDSHILHNIKDEDYSPANGYSKFCLEHLDLLKNEISRLLNNENVPADTISSKIKKTYKNRYFIISRNISKNRDSVNININDNYRLYEDKDNERKDNLLVVI
jgi:hypothetical protein